MSNNPSDIYNKSWPQMAKLIRAMTNHIKGYVNQSRPDDLVDHDTLIMAIQVFALICGDRWGRSPQAIEHMWANSKEIHRLVKLSLDTKVVGEMQTASKKKDMPN